MSRILTISLFTLMLAGCASEQPAFDKTALPDATAAMRQATSLCEEGQPRAEFNASRFMACRVAAERNFAMAIHVRKMDAFDIYADKMLALAAGYDAGTIRLTRMTSRAASIRRDFWRACDCSPAGSRGGDYAATAFLPSSDLTPPGVQLSSTP